MRTQITFEPMTTGLKAVAKKGPSRLPVFRYAGPKLHQGDTTVLLGDAVHTVKPYFGLGANSALEDVISLSTALDGSKVKRARC